MVGMYEPYVAVCRAARRALARQGGDEDAARELRRRGDRERGQDRPRGDRPRRRRRLRPRLPRPHEPDDGDDLEARLQAGLRPARDRRAPRAGAVPLSRRHDRGRAARASTLLFKQDVDPAEVACIVLEPVQGEGGFIPMPPEFVARAARALRHARHPLRRRRGAVRLRAHRHDVGDRALRRRAGPDRLRQDARRRTAARGRDRTRRADGRRARRRPRRDVRRQPRLPARRRSRCSTSSSAPGLPGARGADRGAAAAHASTRSPPSTRSSARCAASARCSRSSSPSRTATPRRRSRAAAREKGLVLLSCGLYGNVIRLLPPLSATDEELERGLAILEEALGDAGSG